MRAGKKLKRVGKVRHCIFHPTERRVIGVEIHRPDAALMFHRKPLFVTLEDLAFEEDELVILGNAAAEKTALKKLGVNWDQCLIWQGMALMTSSKELIGHCIDVEFVGDTGKVLAVICGESSASNAILGKRTIPASMVKGFAFGFGESLVNNATCQSADNPDSYKGCILVADEAATIPLEGGAAAAAGKVTAVATAKAKEGVSKAKTVAAQKTESMRPTMQKAAKKAEAALEEGAFAVGKQLGRSTGMFSAFKEEFNKAKGEDNE